MEDLGFSMHYVALRSYWLDLQVQAFYLLRGCCGSISAGCDAWLSSPSPPPSQSSSSSWTRTHTQECIRIYTYIHIIYLYLNLYVNTFVHLHRCNQSTYIQNSFCFLHVTAQLDWQRGQARSGDILLCRCFQGLWPSSRLAYECKAAWVKERKSWV